MVEPGAARTVSVAIASYNGAQFIGEQLQSIAAQTRQPDEIIVSDDGSTDATRDIVSTFATRVPFPVRLIAQPAQLGILENFLAAFVACSGSYIIYCDQDDWWRSDKLEKQAADLDGGAVLSLHPSAIVDSDRAFSGEIAPRNAVAGLIASPADAGEIHGFGHQMAFTRGVLELLCAVRQSVPPDRRPSFMNSLDVLIPLCASLTGPIIVRGEPLVEFRRHAAATSGAGRPIERAPLPLGQRASEAIANRLNYYRGASIVAEAAHATARLDPEVGAAVLRALRGKVALFEATARIGTAPRMIQRLASFSACILSIMHGTGFTNDRRLHVAKLAAAVIAR